MALAPIPPVPDLERRTRYSNPNSAGPFDVDFPIFGSGTDPTAWIEVFIDGELYTNWTLASDSGPLAIIPRPITDAKVTLGESTNGVLDIAAAERPYRTVQLDEGRGVSARDFNLAVSKLVARQREDYHSNRRTLRLPLGEEVLPVPALSTRAGKIFEWDEDGVPKAGLSSADLLQIRTDAEAARDIAAGYASDAVSQGNVPIYATLAGMSAINVPVGITALRVNGYATAGDGGSGLYKKVDTEPTHEGKFQTADGSWWELVYFGVVFVQQFGAKFDGATDDVAAAVKADAFVAAKGGGAVFYPSGNSIFGKTGDSLTQPYCVLVSSTVRHVGAGRGATNLKLKDSANAHLFLLRATIDGGVTDMTLDGNRDNQSAPGFAGNDPCGIMCATTVERMGLRRLHIKNTVDYGIGIEVGTAKGCDVDDILIEDVGADGIDVKNTSFDSENNRITRVTVRRFGLQGETGEEFAGVDLRGQWFADAIRVEQLGYGKVTTGRAGIRFHCGGGGSLPDSDIIGGGTRSSLTNFFIDGDGDSYKTDLTIRGMWIMDPLVKVGFGHIERVGRGLVRNQQMSSLSDITIDACRRGMVDDSTQTAGGDPLPTAPIYMSATNISISNCTEFGLRLENGAKGSYIGCNLVANAQNLSMGSSVGNCRFIGGSITAQTGSTNVSGGDGTNLFERVRGYTTEAVVLSDEFALDATGVTSLSITHGLSVTPNVQSCSLSLYVNAAQEDFNCVMWIRQTGSTTVTAKVKVTTASGTAGLKGRLILRVRP